MQIIIQPHQTQLSRETIRSMERRILFVLSRFSRAIRTLRIRLTDINGPKGGNDKDCLIIARFRYGEEIVVRGGGQNNSMAMYRCVERLSRVVERKLKQRLGAPIREMRRLRAIEKVTDFDSAE